MESEIATTRQGQGGVTIVDITKDMDFLTAKEVKDTFIRLMNSGCTKIVGNLTRVHLIDSSGLEVLAAAQIKSRGMATHFCIVCSSPNIRRLLATTGLDAILKIYQTEEEALRALQVAS